jgi:hypothetical protein
MGWESLNCGYQRAYCLSPTWYMSMANHGGMISTVENSWFVNQNSLAIYQQSSSRKSGGTGEGSDEFRLTKYLFHASKGFLICRKILDMEPTALLPLRRKSCCGSWSPLKIYRHRPDLNPRTLGPIPGTLTITPPRTTCTLLHVSLKLAPKLTLAFTTWRERTFA